MEEFVSGITIAAAGSLLNFIATKVYNSITGSSKNFVWRNKIRELKSLWQGLEFNELKRKTRIVVIDDEDSFPIDLFRSEGYSIDKWDSVIDYSKLESGFYDIIILDIKGVALHISNDDGLGVLESLKRENPAQIIVAYSQHSFDLSKAKFWELADEAIAKPSDYLKMKNIIDTLIVKQFNPTRYIDALHQLFHQNDFTPSDTRRFDQKLYTVIEEKRIPNWADMLPQAVANKTELINQVKAIGSTIVKFY